MSYEFPSELMYTTTHEWVRVQNSIATVGLTDYAQHQLGDVVFVDLPDIGKVFEKESNVGEIESVKAVGELIMPLSGEVMEINEQLDGSPELVNISPYDGGWMMKIKISHPNEIDKLMSVEKYKELVKSEEK